MVQFPQVVPDRQAHVAGEPHDGGNVRQANVPGAPTGPPIMRSQNCVPWVQNRGPQRKVPDGGVQLMPCSSMSAPDDAAMQGLLWIWPSQPHTRSTSAVQTCGRVRHMPVLARSPQRLSPQSQ